MRDFSAWSVAASLFFSIGLCSSANDVLGTAVSLAGAGNPAAVERSLSGFVSRMGGEVPAPVASAAGVAVSYSKPQTDSRLKRGQDWCLANGQTSSIPADVSGLMGLTDGQTRYPVKGRARRSDDQTLRSFMTGTDTELPIIVTFRAPDASWAVSWRTDVNGRVLSTVLADASGTRVVPNGDYQSQFEAQVSYWGDVFPVGAAVASNGASS